MRITRRLILLVSVPLVVAVAFAARALAPATGQAVRADRLTTMVQAADAAGALTYDLQRERTASASLLASQGSRKRLAELTAATDRSLTRYRQRRAEADSASGGSASALRRVDRSLRNLPSLRSQVRAGSTPLSSMAFGYRILIADLIGYRDSVAQTDGVDAGTADRIRAAAALFEATEDVGRQQVIVIRAIADNGFTPASQQSFEDTRLGYTEATGQLATLGPGRWNGMLERTLSGPQALAAQRLEDQVGRTDAGHKPAVSARSWRRATDRRLTLLRSVERRVDASLLDTVRERRTDLAWWAAGELGLALLTLVGALFVAYRLGRVMIRRLRRLRNVAHDVAHRRLPEAMRTLSEPGAVDDSTPEEIAERAGRPLEAVGHGDEIAEVGEAFNSVHHAAVLLAAQQAESHGRLAETLAGVARRGAQLNRVLTSQLNSVQREELDPQRMEALFALDHLAIRMERNARNLLVLGGYGQGRVRTSSAPCTSVVYAGAQQIEHYERIRLGHIAPTIAVAARAVDDVAHLLAELLDNAARFSPPHTEVGVAAWHLWDRAVLQIADEGVGISPTRRAELNAVLDRPRSDVGAVRSMGLQVVARLADRHDIRVELREADGAGTLVEITLPHAVLANPRGDLAAEVPGGVFPRANRSVPPRRSAPRAPASHAPGAAAGAMARRASAAGPEPPEGGPEDGTDGPDSDGPADPDGATASPPSLPDTSPQPAPSRGLPPKPESGVAGISPAGLPVRRRPTGAGPAGGAGARGGSVSRAGGAAAADGPDEHARAADGAADDEGGRARHGDAPAPSPRAPRRRDSRQVSDVLAAYAQGINRSAGNRRPGPPAPANPPGSTEASGAPSDSDDDDDPQWTQRSTT